MEVCKCVRDSLLRLGQSGDILRDYRSIKCRTCLRPFGFQSKANEEIYFCCSPCLTVPDKDGQQLNVPQKCTGLGANDVKALASKLERELSSLKHGKCNGDDSSEHFGKDFESPTRGGGAGGRGRAQNVIGSVKSMRKLLSGDNHAPYDVEHWRKSVPTDTEEYLEPEDLPPSSDQSVISDVGLRGNKDVIAAARKKSVSPPAPSICKVTMLGKQLLDDAAPSKKPSSNAADRPIKPSSNATATTNKPSSDASALADKTAGVSPGGVRNNKIVKRWTMKNLQLSSSFKDKPACYVCYCWSPIKYTLNSAEDEEALKELQSNVAHYCKKASPLARIPSVGEIVFAPYTDVFYRAEVRSVSEEKNQVSVYFIDFGDKAHVSIGDCREASDKIMKAHPAYGVTFTCEVRGKCPKGAALPEDVVACFNDKVYVDVTKVDLKTKGNLYLNESLTEKLNTKLDDWIFSQTTNDDKKNAANKDIMIENGSTCTEESSLSKAKSQSGRSNPFSTKKSSAAKRTLRNATISPNLKNGAQIRVNFMWNFKKLTISASEDDDQFEILQNLINKHVETAAPITRPLEVDDIVIAPYDDAYYRAVVTSVKSDGKVEARFVDYGDAREVSISDIYDINPDIDAHPIYGVMMAMCEVPDKIPKIQVKEMDDVMGSGGLIEVEERESNSMWSGYLWVGDGDDMTWNRMVLDAIESVI